MRGRVAFWGGAVPGNAAELGALLDAGVVGFKSFLIDTGIPEFQALGKDELRTAMKFLAGAGAPMIVHAEDPTEETLPTGPSDDATYVASRPTAAEGRAIEIVVRVRRDPRAGAHRPPVRRDRAALISAANAAGLPLTAETCPHYLLFAAERVPPAHTEFKCARQCATRRTATRSGARSQTGRSTGSRRTTRRARRS